jgi:hypothetical protein
MATLLIKGMKESVKERLKKQAKIHYRLTGASNSDVPATEVANQENK